MGTLLIVRRPIRPVSAVPVSCVSPHIEAMASPGDPSTSATGQVDLGPADVASGTNAGQLSPGELASVAVSLRALGRRLDQFRDRLSALEVAAQSASGRTSRSTRDSRSSNRSRSS